MTVAGGRSWEDWCSWIVYALVFSALIWSATQCLPCQNPDKSKRHPTKTLLRGMHWKRSTIRSNDQPLSTQKSEDVLFQRLRIDGSGATANKGSAC